jgi:hypothetical protein
MNVRTSTWVIMALMVVAGVPAARDADASHLWREYCDQGIPADETLGLNWFPRGDVFCSLIADPKSDGSFSSYVVGTQSSSFGTDLASVGIGDRFGIFRWNGPSLGEGVELGVSGNIYAQFDLNTESYDLINADYLLSLPLTVRRGPVSARLRVYHQSSHLGDEFVLRSNIHRENFAFESFETLVSLDLGPLRTYGGGEVLFDRRPDDIVSPVAHGGVEFRQANGIPLGSTTRLALVSAADLNTSDELDWKPAWSVRAGFEVRRVAGAEHRTRRFSLLAEFYDGPSPYGQFVHESVKYYGGGFHLGL